MNNDASGLPEVLSIEEIQNHYDLLDADEAEAPKIQKKIGRPPKKSRPHTEIWGMPDRAILSEDEASIYVGLSPSKMADLRRQGKGPRFTQYPVKEDATGTNVPVKYIVEHLKAWQNEYTFSDVRDAAVKRGLAFATLNISLVSMDDLEPFFIEVASGKIEAHARLIGPDDYYDYHPNPKYKLVWLPWSLAYNSKWCSEGNQAIYSRVCVPVLKSLSERTTKS